MAQLAKATALILKTIKFKESDLIVTALTREMGRLSFLAKGARGGRSRFSAALGLLSLSELVYYDRRQLKLLSQADLLQSYPKLKRNYEHLQLAFRAARLLLNLLPEGGGDRASFELCAELFSYLDSRPLTPGQLARGELAFKLKLARVLGVAPRLDRCAGCGAPLQGPIRFSVARGGVIGAECQSRVLQGTPLALGEAKGLQMALLLPFDKLERLQLPTRLVVQGQTMIERFLAYHLRPL